LGALVLSDVRRNTKREQQRLMCIICIGDHIYRENKAFEEETLRFRKRNQMRNRKNRGATFRRRPFSKR
jgi:Na+-transporting NADH:ubiquinone oxidoreductase subunit NqrA